LIHSWCSWLRYLTQLKFGLRNSGKSRHVLFFLWNITKPVTFYLPFPAVSRIIAEGKNARGNVPRLKSELVWLALFSCNIFFICCVNTLELECWKRTFSLASLYLYLYLFATPLVHMHSPLLRAVDSAVQLCGLQLSSECPEWPAPCSHFSVYSGFSRPHGW